MSRTLRDSCKHDLCVSQVTAFLKIFTVRCRVFLDKELKEVVKH